MNQPGQRAFLTWDPETRTESFTVQPQFEGNADDFGMVIPTPSQPKLAEVDRDFFKSLAVFTILRPMDVKKFKPMRRFRGGLGVAADDDYAGAQECAACHEEVVAAMGHTPHAVATGWDAEAACESCHGSGQAHIERGGDVELIVRPGRLEPREASATCLECHNRRQANFSHRQSIHRLGDVGCMDCHDPHTTSEQMLPVSGAELCATCHQAIASFKQLARKLEHHLLFDRHHCLFTNIAPLRQFADHFAHQQFWG